MYIIKATLSTIIPIINATLKSTKLKDTNYKEVSSAKTSSSKPTLE